MRLLIDLEPRDAARGLSIDEALLESARSEGTGAVRLWVSRRAVVIGRSQSAESECSETVRRLGIPILRRVSGGGAVVQYPGNMNVSLAVPEARRLGTVEDAFARFGEALARGLQTLGASVARGDHLLTLGGRKVSGAAQARRGNALLVHATLLVARDTVEMAALLRAMQPGYEPNGTPSRPRATIALGEALGRPVGLPEAGEAVVRGLGEAFSLEWKSSELTSSERTLAEELERARYRSREWNESGRATLRS